MSGTSTPRSSVTPPPTQGGEGPPPLTVGVRFVREYYKTLSTKPETVTRFYQPASMLSVGLGSQQSHPATFESQKENDMKSRFVQEGLEDRKIRFEFENGAIDAQMSVNGGILVVATGHIVYESTEDEEDMRRKAFVHTFFLCSVSSGNKRSYYVHNDVLRFLADDEEKTVVVSNKKASAVAEKEVQLPVAIEEPPAEVIPTETPPVEAEAELTPNEPIPEDLPAAEDNAAASAETMPAADTAAPVVVEEGAPGGGVEESKEPVIEEEEVVESKSDKKADAKGAKKEAKSAEAAAPSKEPSAHAKPAKSSWASVVGTGNGAMPSSQPGTPARGGAAAKAVASPPKTPKAAPAEAPPTEATVSAKEPTANTNNSTGGGNKNARVQHNKRDPDCTLVIKNFDASNTTEADIRGLFEHYAGENEAKVIGCTVSSHKGLAFVDYDSPKPVLAAVDEHKKEPLKLKGYTLDIYQKTVDKPSSRRNQGTRGAGRGNQGGGGGGRPYRRSGSGGAGRGERGGGGGPRGRGGGGGGGAR